MRILMGVNTPTETKRKVGSLTVADLAWLMHLDPPPQYADRSPKEGRVKDGLAYGEDNRGHQSKDKSGGGYMVVSKRFLYFNAPSNDGARTN
jgi:hypothetical protein